MPLTMRQPAKVAKQARWFRGEAARLADTDPDEAAAADATAERLESMLRATSRCVDCGRPLRDPVSVADGIGPDCAQLRREHAEAAAATL